MVYRRIGLALNRTRLELKPPSRWCSGASHRRLIAPDWNWNSKWRCCTGSNTTLNRTRLELKLQIKLGYLSIGAPLNRTRLELKLQVPSWTIPTRYRLIAPDWNWNKGMGWCNWELQPRLIAPDWNWNHVSNGAGYSGFGRLIAPDWNWNIIVGWATVGASYA